MKAIKTIKSLLTNYNPCSEGREFLKSCRSTQEAWDKCTEPPWMLWALAQIRPLTKEESTLLAIKFARRVLSYFEQKYPNDKRPRQALEAAEAYLSAPSRATADAAYAARAAADAAAGAASWNAADAARAAADAAADAAAAAAADAAAYAAAGAAADAATRAATRAAAYAADYAARAATFEWLLWRRDQMGLRLCGIANAAEKKAQCEIIRTTINISSLL